MLNMPRPAVVAFVVIERKLNFKKFTIMEKEENKS